MPDDDKQRIADFERELRLKDERIRELKDELDQGREGKSTCRSATSISKRLSARSV
jgi:hypothetical protein